MKLIVGKHLIEQNKVVPQSFEELSVFLNELGIAQETLECAFVYLLRLSGNYLNVSEQAMLQFITECRRDAQSHTASGMSFPIQDELLEYSESEEDDASEPYEDARIER